MNTIQDIESVETALKNKLKQRGYVVRKVERHNFRWYADIIGTGLVDISTLLTNGKLETRVFIY